MRYLLFFLFLVVSCAVTKQELDPKVYYVHDLEVKVNGKWLTGYGVVPIADKFKIKVKSVGQMTTLLVQTCHRQLKVHDAGKRERIEFTPQPDEREQRCGLMRFSSFDKKHGKHAQALVWIDHGVYKLTSTVYCNGKKHTYQGVSMCHALNGLYQRIIFNEEVKLVEQEKERCKIATPFNGLKQKRKVFRFKMPNRECQFRFVNAKGDNHFLYTSGYEQNIIRN